jgi:ABC-type antimicrobial peptide transport system permease subunit
MFKTLQAKWSELFPEVPFEGGHQEDVWGFYYEEIKIHGLVWRIFALIAITVAGLGLYGLITLNVAGRAKEFSIRKVLGAGLRNIAANITNQYAVLLAIALILGAPAGHLLSKVIIETAYTYHMSIDFTAATTAVVILTLVLITTASTQVIKVFNASPAEGLKTE